MSAKAGFNRASQPHKFVVEEGDDMITIYLDDLFVACLTHDEDGYQGMQRAQNIVEEIATILGTTVVKT